jgi:hypothetical protein
VQPLRALEPAQVAALCGNHATEFFEREAAGQQLLRQLDSLVRGGHFASEVKHPSGERKPAQILGQWMPMVAQQFHGFNNLCRVAGPSDANLKQPGVIVCSRRLDDPDLTGRKMFRVKQNIPSVRHDS